mmetsp:Transcript_29402/g.94875  ORF Transcript_29402/g.94875 Transcript_29402/m.94875 type:complete len:256 (-) Transcript_29402:488-1255(-)
MRSPPAGIAAAAGCSVSSSTRNRLERLSRAGFSSLGSHSSILPRSQRTSALRSSPPPCDALTSCVSSNKVSSTACRVTARCSRSKLVARKAEGSSPSSRLHWKTAARNESVSAAGSGCVGSVKARAGMSRFLLAGGAASAYASVQQRISPTAQAWARVAPSVAMRARSSSHSEAIWEQMASSPRATVAGTIVSEKVRNSSCRSFWRYGFRAREAAAEAQVGGASPAASAAARMRERADLSSIEAVSAVPILYRIS